MLSGKDIKKELGKGINIYPLKMDNIKENSINLSISEYCWTLGSATVYKNENDGTYSIIQIDDCPVFKTLKEGDLCTIEQSINTNNGNKQIILLPHSTTIVETEEVIGIGDNIGGAFHSKVGIAAKGIGHIGTMLGPGYCGHLMVPIHNITDEIICLDVGSTFVSVTFDYLNSKVKRTSSTSSGHLDKFSEMHIKIDDHVREAIDADWKSNISGIRAKLKKSDSYKLYEEELKEKNLLLIFYRKLIDLLKILSFFMPFLK